MKRIWYLPLVLVLIFTLYACSGTEETPDDSAAVSTADSKVEETAEHTHSFGEWEIVTAPTCTEKGEEKRTCKNCDHYETREVAATGHSYTNVVTAPTCTEKGYTTHTCSCGDSYVDSYVEANGHNYGNETLNISADGKTATLDRSCGTCEDVSRTPYTGDHISGKDVYRFENGSRVDIADGEFVVDGKTYYIVNNEIQINVYIRIENNVYYYGTDGVKSNEPLTDREVTDSKGNTYYVVNNKVQNNTYVRIENNVYYYGADGVKSSEALTNVKVTDSQGKTYYLINNRIQVNVYVVIKNSINYFDADGSMLKSGTHNGYTFNATGALTGSGIIVEINGKRYDVEGDAASIHQHRYTATVTAPTCTEKGYTTHTCACGDSYVDNHVEATGHTYTDVVTKPTCTEKGYTTHTCACGDSYVDTYVESTGHTYTDIVTKPTCTKKGYTTHTCSCGDSYVDNYVNAIGHTYGDWSQTKAPTCTEKGEERKTCKNCDHYETREIAATGQHQYINGACKDCGKKEPLPSEGLKFTLNSDGKSYTVAGIGTCTDTEIIIPSTYNELPVTSIGNSAFYRTSRLTRITIPDSVTSIGNIAFSGCSSLKSITIPNSVTSIGDSAFSGCSSLTRIIVASGNTVYHSADNCLIETASKTLISGCMNSVIPTDGSVTCIGDSAFSGRTSLTSITIPNSVTSIGNYAFDDCSGLTSITIPNSVRSIGDGAFNNCPKLASITIPNSVTRIGENAFRTCTSLTSITIPNSVTSIGSSAFYGTAYYKNTDNWDNGVLYIGNWLIEAKTTISGAYSIKDGTTYIADRAFSGCTSLTSITIPDSVTSIGNYAFNYCPSLKSITFKGTKAQWNAISKGDYWNNFTSYYKIYCTDGEISK